MHSEAGGVVIVAHADPALVIADIADTVRGSASQFGIDKIMHIDRFRRSFGARFAAIVFEVPYQFLLLRIDRNNRLTRCQKRGPDH